MDPETCWREIVEDLANGIAIGAKGPLKPTETRERMGFLESWLFKGGFVPEDLREVAGRPDGTGIRGLEIPRRRAYAVAREKARKLIEEAGGYKAWRNERRWEYEGTKYCEREGGVLFLDVTSAPREEQA